MYQIKIKKYCYDKSPQWGVYTETKLAQNALHEILYNDCKTLAISEELKSKVIEESSDYHNNNVYSEEVAEYMIKLYKKQSDIKRYMLSLYEYSAPEFDMFEIMS